MANLSVRNLEDETVTNLRIRAAQHGVSMEEEIRQILKQVAATPERQSIPLMKKKQIPEFVSEDQEREFWSEADSVDYIDWDTAKHVMLSNLKPSQKTISLRLPEMMLA